MATKHMNMQEAFEMSAKLWKRIAVTGIAFIKTRTEDGKGVKQNNRAYTFPAYTPDYAKLKAVA